MDCQGNKDLKQSTLTLDNLIMFLGLQLSDMHILNMKGTQGADDFERLGVSRFCVMERIKYLHARTTKTPQMLITVLHWKK